MTRESHVKQPQGNKERRSSAARQAQWRFQADLLDQLPDPVIAVDQDERITYLNRAAVAQYGVDPAGAIGQPLHYLHRYEWLQPEDELLAEAALAQQGHWRGENRHIRQDGSALQVESLVTFLYDEIGNRTGMVAVIRDMTDRKQAEHTLRANELRYRRLADTMPQLIWTADRNGDVNYYNIHIHDFDPSVWQGVTGFDWASMIHPDDLAPTLTTWQEAVRQQQPYTYEHRLHMADGSWRWHLSRAVLVQDPDQGLKWYGTATDIHERKLAEEALRASEERLRLATEAGGVGIFDHDLITNQTEVSPIYRQITGLAPDAVVTRESWLALVHPEDRPLVMAIWQEAQSTSTAYYYECRLLRPDGALAWIEVNAWVTPDETGRGVRITGAVRDITERKQIALHQQFLLDLNSTLRTLSDATAIQQTVVEQLGQYLGADRCRFNAVDLSTDKSTLLAVWSRPGLPPPTDINPLSTLAPAAYISSAQAGRTLVIQDAHQDEQNEIIKALMLAHGFVATIRVPCLREGAWVASLHVLQTTPRQWRADEVELVESVVHHFWPLAEKARTEKELRRQEGFLRQLADNVPGLVGYLDAEERYRFVNMTFEEWFQRPRQQILGYTVAEIMGKADSRPLAAYRQQALAGAKVRYETDFTYPDGITRTIWGRYQPDLTADGRVLGFYLFLMDITERKQMEEALHASEARFRAVQQASPDGYMIFESVRNEQGVIIDFCWLYVNPASEQLIGRTQAELLGKRLLVEMPGNREEGLFDAYVQVVETGVVYQREFCYQHEGIDRWFRNTAAKAGDGFAVAFSDITVRKQAEIALQQSNAILNGVLECSNDAIFVRDLTGRYLLVNEAGVTQVGLPKNAILGRRYQDLFTAAEMAAIQEEDRAVLGQGQAVTLEHVITQQGALRYWHTLKMPLRDADGAIIGLISSARDLTERKAAEEALRLSEARYRTIFENAGVSLWEEDFSLVKQAVDAMITDWRAAGITDLGAAMRDHCAAHPAFVRAMLERVRILNVNEETVRLYGRPKTELLRPFAQHFTDETLTHFVNQLVLIARNGQRYTFDGPIETPQGETRHVAFTLVFPTEADSDFTRVLLSGLDITTLKEAEMALRSSEARFRHLAEAMPQIVWTCQADGSMTYINQQWQQYSGMPTATTLAEGMWPAIHPDDQAANREQWQQALISGTAYQGEIRLQRHDGAYCWFLERAIPVHDDADVITQWFGVSMDIDERKRHERHQQFLSNLGMDLRLLSDSATILTQLVKRLGDYLHVAGCRVNEVDLVQGQFTLQQDWVAVDAPWPSTTKPGVYPLADLAAPLLLSALQAGQTVVVANTLRDPRTAPVAANYAQDQVHSLIGIPIFHQGHWRATLSVKGYGERQWRADEVALVESVAGQLSALLEKVRAEEALRASEEIARRQLAEIEAIYATAPVGLAVLDAELRYVRVNKQLAELNGIAAADHIGQTVRAVVPNLADSTEPLFRQVMETGQPIIGMEILGETPAQPGVQRVWLENFYSLYNDAGQVIGINVVVQDITARKQAEEWLRQSEERLRLALAGGGMGIWESQIATNRSLWSPEEYALFGLPLGVEITNELFSRLVHPDDLPGLQAAMERLFSSGKDHVGEFRIIRSDGAVHWLADRVTVLRDEVGQPVRLLGINFDITERKAREAMIRQQLAEIEAIYATAPIGLCLVDCDLRYVRINETLATINGGAIADYLGRTLAETMSDAGYRLVAPLYRQVIETGLPLLHQEVHESYVDPAQARDWLANYYPLKNAEGVVIGVNAVILEITERKRHERQLQELNRQLQKSNATLEERVRERTKSLEEANRTLSTINRELEQFTYAAAHDLRTPLRGIANLVQWISEDAASVLPPASQRHLEQLGGRVKRLEKMLEDLLLYSRVGRVRYRAEEVDVQQLLCGLLDLLAPPVGFVIKLSPQLPTFTALRVPLELVFRNLLSNAMRHHHEPVRGQVEITVRDLGEWYEFRVSDNGPGIDPQYHERIFGMFQTLKPRDQVEGSGVGLALVKKTMENIGGRIWMESVVSQGTAFYFTWPKEQKAEKRRQEDGRQEDRAGRRGI